MECFLSMKSTWYYIYIIKTIYELCLFKLRGFSFYMDAINAKYKILKASDVNRYDVAKGVY